MQKRQTEENSCCASPSALGMPERESQCKNFVCQEKKAQGKIFVGKRQVRSSRKDSLVQVQHPLKPEAGARPNFKQDENLMELQTPQWKQWKEGGEPRLSGQAPAQVIKFYLTKFSLHPQQDTCLLSAS